MTVVLARRDDGALLLADRLSSDVLDAAVIVSSDGAWLTTVGSATSRGDWTVGGGPVMESQMEAARRLLASTDQPEGDVVKAFLADMAAKHLPGRHNQETHGNDASPDVISGDKLKLAGRIPLADGERLAGSDVFKTRDSGLVPMALTDGPGGRRLRIGTGVLDEDKKRWAGRNLGSTVNLDEAGMRELREVLDEMPIRGAEAGKRFRAIEDREDELDQERRDVLKRRYPNLSKAQAKRLDQVDRDLEDVDSEIARREQRIRDTADYMAQRRPDDRRRWDEIETEIATLDPQRDGDDIDTLRREQARLSDMPGMRDNFLLLPKLRREREELLAEQRELTANPVPLSPDDQADLDRVDAEIADNRRQYEQIAESTVFGGVIPGEWADLTYEVYTHETSHEYANMGINYRLAARPKDADPDWHPTEYENATEFKPKELGKLAAMLGQLTGDESKSFARGVSRKHLPGQHNQESHGNDNGVDAPNPLDKLKLGKRAPAGFTVRSSRKLKTDYADVGVAEVDTPDGPEVRIGVIGGERGKWDAGFTGEARKTQLREEIARKQALMDSDEEQPDGIEDEIIELESELEDLDGERTAILSPGQMADLRRQLDEALELAKANKAKVDADLKASDAIDKKRDAIIDEHSDADLERRVRKASYDLREARRVVQGLEHDLEHGSRHGWDPEYVADRLASWKADVVKREAELAPLLARRAQIVPADVLAQIEDLDRQHVELTSTDITDILTAVEVSASNGTRIRAEIWGSDDIDDQWTSSRLYVLAPGETTDDADNGDEYGNFPGLKGLNKLIAGLGESSSDQPKSALGRGVRRKHLPGQHNQQSHAGTDFSVLADIEVMDREAFADTYGTLADENSVELEGFSLTARYFENGESLVSIDLPGNRFQVLDETDSDGMTQLAYDIEDALSAADDFDGDEDPNEIAWDTDSPQHGFNISVNGEGQVMLRPVDAGDHLELSPDEARLFVDALRDTADSYEDAEDAGEFEQGAKSLRRRVKHLPGRHDQRDHGRSRRPKPDIPTPDVPAPAPPKPRRQPKPKPPREDPKPAPEPKPARQPRTRRPKPANAESATPPKPTQPRSARPTKLTPAQAQQMQHEMLIGNQWTAEHVRSLHAWTTAGYHDIRMMIADPNHEPFLGIGGRATVKGHIRNMHDAMRPLPKAVKLYRKVDPEGVGLPRGADAKQLVGQRKQNANFTATSIEPDAGFLGAFRPIHIEIDAPAGTRAAYLEDLTETKGEHEMLLDAGTVIEFTEAKDRRDGVTVLKARVVP